MRVPRRYTSAVHFFALFAFGLVGSAVSVFAQNHTPESQLHGSSKATRDSVEVAAHLSPAEEIEDGKLNDLYQSIGEPGGTCTEDIIRRYQSELIPAAEKSPFKTTRSKYLFLAKRELGFCYLHQMKYKQAEAHFQEIQQYLPVWPGTEDSSYPLNFRALAMAQMGQDHWTQAEQSLLRSISLFDPIIAAREKNDAESTSHFRSSQVESRVLLALVYLRLGRTQDALATMEKAYDDATKYKLLIRDKVIVAGQSLANESGDAKAQEVWSHRSPNK